MASRTLKDVSLTDLQAAVSQALESLTGSNFDVQISGLQFERDPAIVFLGREIANFDVRATLRKNEEGKSFWEEPEA